MRAGVKVGLDTIRPRTRYCFEVGSMNLYHRQWSPSLGRVALGLCVGVSALAAYKNVL